VFATNTRLLHKTDSTVLCVQWIMLGDLISENVRYLKETVNTDLSVMS
jgi:hypothetical protein